MSNAPITILRADWVAPMHRPRTGAIRGGGVAFRDGVILAVDEGDQLALTYPQATVEVLGAAVLLPGLVNAHVHLELSDCQCGVSPAGGFSAWLLKLVQRNATAAPQLASLIGDAVAEGVKQSLRFGVTSVGDITRQPRLTRPLLRGVPLRVTSYGEVQALARRRGLFDERFAAATDGAAASETLRVGLSPHAPYTVEPAGFRACLAAARETSLPVATHLAESPEEGEFLAHHTGPFRQLWEAIEQWDDDVPFFSGGPIRFAKLLGLLDYPTLLAHVNYSDDDEMALLANGRASVVYCPRTHQYFGHRPHRFRDMIDRGINVAVGTDSCASSPDLNLVDDLRLIHQIAPEFPVEELWRMGTIRAARAIDSDASVGSIAPAKLADFAAFPVRTEDPLREILETAVIPRAVWVGGTPVRLRG